MIREVQGPRDQIVTTWGRDLEGTRWVGEERPLSFTVTCRCGKAKRATGFPNPSALRKLRFLCMNWAAKGEPEEWFCSIECAVKFEPARTEKRFHELRDQAAFLNERAEKLNVMLSALPGDAPG